MMNSFFKTLKTLLDPEESPNHSGQFHFASDSHSHNSSYRRQSLKSKNDQKAKGSLNQKEKDKAQGQGQGSFQPQQVCPASVCVYPINSNLIDFVNKNMSKNIKKICLEINQNQSSSGFLSTNQNNANKNCICHIQKNSNDSFFHKTNQIPKSNYNQNGPEHGPELVLGSSVGLRVGSDDPENVCLCLLSTHNSTLKLCEDHHARIMLENCTDLATLRYNIVPKLVSDDIFWRIYFRELKDYLNNHFQIIQLYLYPLNQSNQNTVSTPSFNFKNELESQNLNLNKMETSRTIDFHRKETENYSESQQDQSEMSQMQRELCNLNMDMSGSPSLTGPASLSNLTNTTSFQHNLTDNNDNSEPVDNEASSNKDYSIYQSMLPNLNCLINLNDLNKVQQLVYDSFNGISQFVDSLDDAMNSTPPDHNNNPQPLFIQDTQIQDTTNNLNLITNNINDPSDNNEETEEAMNSDDEQNTKVFDKLEENYFSPNSIRPAVEKKNRKESQKKTQLNIKIHSPSNGPGAGAGSVNDLRILSDPPSLNLNIPLTPNSDSEYENITQVIITPTNKRDDPHHPQSDINNSNMNQDNKKVESGEKSHEQESTKKEIDPKSFTMATPAVATTAVSPTENIQLNSNSKEDVTASFIDGDVDDFVFIS